MIRTFILMSHRPATAVLAPVGVLAIDGDSYATSWIDEVDAAAWRDRIANADAAGQSDWARVTDHWSESANGITWDLNEIALDEAARSGVGAEGCRTVAERLAEQLLADPNLMSL